jgi:geranylgeranyl pyrophosphate synthase
LESITDKDSASRIQLSKLHKKIQTFIVKKLLDIARHEEFKGDEKIHKTDVVRYRFSDKNVINNKYRKLQMIDKDKLIDYVERTYGSVCQCAFVCGWLLGFGDEKMINNLERLGTHLGLLIKLSTDFKNLERDLNNATTTSTNLIINYGIHECFRLFDDSKIKLLEGCLTLDIYNITIKEVIDHIEKTFDNHLKNSDLELVSRYSSFSSAEQYLR